MASKQPAAEGSSNMEPVSLQPAGSGAGGGGGGGGVGRSARGEYFECRTCNRRFASFQALGGHRTGHTRQAQALQRRRQRRRRREHGRASNLQQGDRRRVHGCVVCGLEFSMGQALGGHMRRHRNEAAAPPAAYAAVAGVERPEMLDLNSPPVDGEGNQEVERSEQVPRLLNLLA
ncbi:hypothetical protein ABZP36_012893 [Zizania latifolia]